MAHPNLSRAVFQNSSNDGGIKAAAWKHGTRKTPFPWALELDRRCRRYNCLPEAGGMIDQDEFLINLMIGATNAFTLSQKRMKDYTAADVREVKAIKGSLNG
jgi:hypothetical protein